MDQYGGMGQAPVPQGAKFALSHIQMADRLASRIVTSLHNLFGYQYHQNQEFYIYTTTTSPISLAAAVGSTAQGTVEITQEADFVATKIISFARDATDPDAGANTEGTTGQPFEVRLIDGSTDRQMMNNFQHSLNVVGTAQRPGILPKARLFTRNSNITVEFRSLGTPQITEIFFALWGYKIYDLAALDLTRRR